jgi:predicted nucleic acid-binding protein
MPDKPVVLIDLNILLDVLQKRERFYQASARLLAAVEVGKVRGLVAAHTITTLFYLVRKDKSAAEARATITNLLQFIEIAPIEQSTIEQALNLDYGDFEDAVQMISAVQSKADYLITRNERDYRPPLLTVLQPVDFLATLE